MGKFRNSSEPLLLVGLICGPVPAWLLGAPTGPRAPGSFEAVGRSFKFLTYQLPAVGYWQVVVPRRAHSRRTAGTHGKYPAGLVGEGFGVGSRW